MFGVIELSETMVAAGADKTPLQQTTESAYRQVFALLETLHYPYLFRFWNYIVAIDTHSFGLERYRQFNQGRQDVFLAPPIWRIAWVTHSRQSISRLMCAARICCCKLRPPR